MADDLSRRLYHCNLESWTKLLTKKYFSDRELGVKVVDNGIILPARADQRKKGGVCDSNLKFVAGLLRSSSAAGWGNILAAYPVKREEIVQSDEEVIFGGVMMGHFGHFISECLIRLWYVVEHPEDQRRIAFIATARGKKEFHYALFAIMGGGIARDRIIFVEKPTQFKSIIVPDVSNYSHQYFTKEWLLPYRAVVKNITPGNRKKIYLTRTAFEGDKRPGIHCFGEKYFEDFFVKKGYSIVAPERLSLREQIGLVSGADEIASTLGSLSHFAMFCKPGTKFIMLDRADGGVVGIQCLINEATDIDWYIVDVSKNYLYCDRYTGACLLGSTQNWARFVSEHFGEHIEANDDKFFFSESLEKYITFWCKKYAQTARLPSSLKSLCNRLAALEQQSDTTKDSFIQPYEKIDELVDGWCEHRADAAYLLDVIRRLCKRVAALEGQPCIERPILEYATHVARKGWLPKNVETGISGVIDQGLRVEAIKINFSEPYCDVFYAVYYPKDGWTKEVSNGAMAGTTGKSKPIFGIKIRLDETGAQKFNILYRIHDFNGNWSAWAKNGEDLISTEFRINAVQIFLEPLLP